MEYLHYPWYGFILWKGVLYNSEITCGICHKEVVVAASVTLHIHIIMPEGIYCLFYGRDPIQQKPYGNCRTNLFKAVILLGRLLLQGKYAYCKTILIYSVKRRIRQSHHNGEVCLTICKETLSQTKVHSIYHRDGFLAALRSGAYKNSCCRNIILLVFCKVTVVVVPSHKKIDSLCVRYCKCAAT